MCVFIHITPRGGLLTLPPPYTFCVGKKLFVMHVSAGVVLGVAVCVCICVCVFARTLLLGLNFVTEYLSSNTAEAI